MKKIIECYPELIEETEYFYTLSNYQPLIESYGFDILLQVDDSDYQGDSRILYRDGNRYGLLIFGWGSCSGCDALQSCNSIQDVENLQKELFEKIKWFDPVGECLWYFNTHDWDGDYSTNDIETKEFVEKAKVLLMEHFLSNNKTKEN